VPSPASHRRFSDLLLNDGLPQGYRLYQGRRITIFNEISVLTPSVYATYEVVIENITDVARLALVALAEKHEIGIEEWSTHRIPVQKRPGQLSKPVHAVTSVELNSEVRYGIAARSQDEIVALLDIWRSTPGISQNCSIQSIHCVFASFAGVA
jgi:hypothetical protein